MSMQEKTFHYRGATIHYWEYGDATWPTIVMVHGFRGTHHGLQRVIDQLPDYHIIVPDLPGFGDSEPLPHEHSIENYVAFLDAFMTSFHFTTPPMLLGHSFGSVIASHFAAEHPTALTKLILVNPIGAPALEGPKAILTKLAIFYYWLGRKLPQKLSHAWLANPLIVKIMSVSMTKTHDKPTRAYIHDQHLTYFSRFTNPQVVAEAFNASVSHDVREVAARLTMPTLLIAGDQDDITPLARQQLLVKMIPNGQLKVIESVGHLIHYETAERAAVLIKNFVDNTIS
jgi:pimeloyl-ACP methyl ester carboxylesterase